MYWTVIWLIILWENKVVIIQTKTLGICGMKNMRYLPISAQERGFAYSLSYHSNSFQYLFNGNNHKSSTFVLLASDRIRYCHKFLKEMWLEDSSHVSTVLIFVKQLCSLTICKFKTSYLSKVISKAFEIHINLLSISQE